MDSDPWGKLVEVHVHAKVLVLRAEELGPGHELFFPPIMQQRDGYDHIIRVKTAELGLKEFDDDAARDEYIRCNLDKALGHEYRAFFDAADWLGILYREKIQAAMKGYSPACVEAVIPTYYSEIVPKVERLSREIGTIRSRKDIGTDVLEEVGQYRKVLDTLDEDWGRIVDSRAALEQWKSQEEASRRKTLLLQIVIGLVLAFAGALAGWLLRGG